MSRAETRQGKPCFAHGDGGSSSSSSPKLRLWSFIPLPRVYHYYPSKIERDKKGPNQSLLVVVAVGVCPCYCLRYGGWIGGQRRQAEGTTTVSDLPLLEQVHSAVLWLGVAGKYLALPNLPTLALARAHYLSFGTLQLGPGNWHVRGTLSFHCDPHPIAPALSTKLL